MSVPSILLALAGNRTLTAEHIDALLAIGDPELSREVAREQHLDAGQVDRLAGSGRRDILVALIESGNLAAERIPRDDPWAILAAVDRADAPDDLLYRLAGWPDVAIRVALGEHASERPDIARLVAGDENCSVASKATRLRELPEDLATRLSGRAEACVRIALASNTNTPSAILAGLIGDGSEPGTVPCPHQPDIAAATREIELAVAGNPSAPTATVELLAVRPDPLLALELAGRSDLRDNTYQRLLSLHDYAVTARVAMNWAVPPDLLRELYDVEAGRWRDYVLANPRTPLDLLVRHRREGGSPRTWNNPDLDGLLAMARDIDPQVRYVAAASHKLPADVRAALIDDSDVEVACRASQYYAVPAAQVKALATRHGSVVFPYVAGHPSCPPDLLLTIAMDSASSAGTILDVAVHESAPPAALEACLRHPHAVPAVAGNPATPPDTLIRLASHPDHEVLWELARNPSLPAKVGGIILQAFATS